MENQAQFPQIVDASLIPDVSAENRAKTATRAKRVLNLSRELCLRSDGTRDIEEEVRVLRTALERVDPRSKRTRQGALMLDTLSENLSKQGRGTTIWKLKKAVVEQILHGASATTFSATAVKERMRFWAELPEDADSALGLRPSPASDAPPSVEASSARPRKRRKDALASSAKRGVQEFVYCYCKFTEDQYVCLLTKEHIWKLYNTFHDREGGYYPEGILSSTSACAISYSSRCDVWHCCLCVAFRDARAPPMATTPRRSGRARAIFQR